MAVMNVTKENFTEMVNSTKPVLLDFYATWCGPCKMVSPLVDQIADEHSEFTVGKIDVDEQPELAAQFGVISIPTLVVMKNGRVTAQEVGFRPKPVILDMLKG
jgi:thioredoxin 1